MMSIFIKGRGFIRSLCTQTRRQGFSSRARSIPWPYHVVPGLDRFSRRHFFFPSFISFRVNYFAEDVSNNHDDHVRVIQTRSYDVVRPGIVSPTRAVPSRIMAPNYKIDRAPKRRNRIDRKSETDLIPMRESCALAKKILDIIESRICIGMTTDEIDRIAHEEIINHNAYPSPLSYHGFPKSVCTSVNNVACHGIPDDRPLADGDIINVDITVYHKGYHGDCSATFPIGNVDKSGLRLIEGARRCRDEAIRVCGPGKRFSIIGKTISGLAESMNFNVVTVFCGHGIGTYFHGQPDVFHFDNDLSGTMEEGMTFTIEPVLSEGSDSVIVLEDGWTAVTSDDSRAAQFEHTILITSQGSEILTL